MEILDRVLDVGEREMMWTDDRAFVVVLRFGRCRCSVKEDRDFLFVGEGESRERDSGI